MATARARDAGFAGFERSLLRFLAELEEHNERAWFQLNKSRYLGEVLEPALDFIAAMQPHIKRISPHFDAIARRTGGSLMRVYRDTRFSPGKQPYKTNVGIQFRHTLGKDVHAPGFYFHIENGGSFLGVGLWRPGTDALARIRDHIVDHPRRWRRARDEPRFAERFSLAGDSLTRAPRGYDPGHPLIADLRRKDFIALAGLDTERLLGPRVVTDTAQAFTRARGFMRFLCEALEVPF